MTRRRTARWRSGRWAGARACLVASVATVTVGVLSVLALGIKVAENASQSPSSGISAPVESDRVLDPGAWARVGKDNGGPVAARPGASDIPRSHPLFAGERDRTVES